MPLLIHPYLSHIKSSGSLWLWSLIHLSFILNYLEAYAFDHKSISLSLNYREAYGFDHKSISLSYKIIWKPMALILNPYLSHNKLSGSLWLWPWIHISLILNYLEAYGFYPKSISLSYKIIWKPMALIINPYLSHIKLPGRLCLWS